MGDSSSEWRQKHLKYVSRLQGKSFLSNKGNREDPLSPPTTSAENPFSVGPSFGNFAVSHEHFLKVVETKFNLLSSSTHSSKSDEERERERRERESVGWTGEARENREGEWGNAGSLGIRTFQYTASSHAFQLVGNAWFDPSTATEKEWEEFETLQQLAKEEG